ncbi:MAG TPA: putative 2-dehydropantoate 2-reductase [Geobacteraceae bacterium]|nr:putative 2-dehydropantoate 2-reductase [Geobacteraceae bacterium]
MRIAVVGAGALGLYYGALLQKSGNEVNFLLRSDYEAVSSGGITVYSINGDFHLAEVKGFRTPTEIGPVDLVLVGLKTFANEYFNALISPLVGPDTLILTLQNGLGNEEKLADIFGKDKIFGGVAFLCSYRVKPGVIKHLGEGRVLLGKFAQNNSTRTEKIASCFCRAGIKCLVVSDLKRARWEKLVWNIPFNGLCALMEKPVDAFLKFEPTRRLIHEIMLEVITVANTQSLVEEIPFSLAEKLVTSSSKMGQYKPSMMIDRIQGRPMEIEAIFGIPLQFAEEKRIQMPRVRQIYALLRLIEENTD